ncbi:hypothetical protein [Paenibacillus sp. GCM10027629]
MLRERFIQIERGNFLPKETITRAEAAVMLYRIYRFIH